MRKRRLARAQRVAMGGILVEPQVGPNTDRAQVADDRLGMSAANVRIEVKLEAVGVAGLGQELLGLGRIIGVARRIGIDAAELGREAGYVRDPRIRADKRLE